jgi:Flp pilus assembly protein TadB
MRRLLSWIANLVSVAYGGPGLVDLGDQDLVETPADHAAPRWVSGIAVLTPLVVIVLALLGLPWPLVAVVAALLLIPLLVTRIEELRRR